MTQEERKIIANIVLTLADPVGNWPMAWEHLCELAELDPAQYDPPFKSHPFYNLPRGQRDSTRNVNPQS